MSKKPLPKLRPCIVAALELLGLDDARMPAGRARQALAEVDSFGDFVRRSPLQGHLSISGRRVLVIVPAQDQGASLFVSVLQLALLQNDLLGHDVLMRGGIVLGNAVASGDVVIGPGITEAERLRDEVATVPRVVVDPDVFRRVEYEGKWRLPQHTVTEELGYLRKVLRQDADGVWYTDHLLAFGLEEKERALYLHLLADHRRVVVQKLERSSSLDRSSLSWTWLWSYHNLVIEELKAKWSGDAKEIAELHIPATSALLYKFPVSVEPSDAPRGPSKT